MDRPRRTKLTVNINRRDEIDTLRRVAAELATTPHRLAVKALWRGLPVVADEERSLARPRPTEFIGQTFMGTAPKQEDR